ncbi:MAG: M48 family metallopeptidase [Bacteroidota bacterium]
MKHYCQTSIILVLTALFIPALLGAQKGYYEGEEQVTEVTTFEPPFSEITILIYGEEQTFLVDKKTKYAGLKGKSVAPNQVEEGTWITKVTYQIAGDDFVATKIETDISADGSIKVSGLFEGTEEGMGIVDGYPIKLLPGTMLQGEKRPGRKGKCDCGGMLINKFDHNLLKEGKFYVEVQGFQGEDGVISAKKIFLCRNTFGRPEQEMLAAVNGNLTTEMTRITQLPNGVFDAKMGLYNGEIRVGQYGYKLADDIALQGYINQVGYRLLPEHAAEQQVVGSEVNYRFYVIEDKVPNAFAFPNGMIFIHTGLLDIIENEAQLAAVLGHEIAHVTHEHGRERYASTKLIGDIKGVAEGLLDRSLKTKFARYSANLSGDVMSSLVDVSKQLTPAAISNIIKPQPKFESQADRVGLWYAYQAGYDIREASAFWEKMQALTGETSFQGEMLSSMVSALKSDRFAWEHAGKSPLERIGAAGTDALGKQLLDTIYTSHPKARKRARAIDQLVGSVYADTDWSQTRVKREKYEEMVGR